VLVITDVEKLIGNFGAEKIDEKENHNGKDKRFKK